MSNVPDVIEIMMNCPNCGGRGEWDEPYTIIDPKAMDKHVKEHAYSMREVVDDNKKHPKKEWIGANCDCPRVTKTKHQKCAFCHGVGMRIVNFRTPKPGDTVKVKQEVLTALFGAGEEPDPVAQVHKVEYPFESALVELEHPVGVYVTWDKLTREGGIPRGVDPADVTLWTLDITEFTR